MIENFTFNVSDVDRFSIAGLIIIKNINKLDLKSKREVNIFIKQFSTYFYKLEDIESVKLYFLDNEYYNMIYVMDLMICEKNINYVKYNLLNY